MKRMFGQKPKPKQESEPSRPEAFVWADRVNAAARHSQERKALIREAREHGVVLILNRFPLTPDYSPAGAEDYTFLDPMFHSPDE